MSALYDVHAKKRAKNLSINSDLLDQLERESVNLSKECESHLAHVLENIKAQKWEEDNAEAFDDYRRFVETHGSFGERNRRF